MIAPAHLGKLEPLSGTGAMVGELLVVLLYGYHVLIVLVYLIFNTSASEELVQEVGDTFVAPPLEL